jgi:hypothetical protein
MGDANKKPARQRNKSDIKADNRPLWAERFEIGLLQAGFVDAEGKLDTRKAGKHFNVTYKAVEHWAKGLREPKYWVMVELRRLTGLSLDWLFGAQGVPPFQRDDPPGLDSGKAMSTLCHIPPSQ